MVFAFAPIVGLLLGLFSIRVPWDTLLLSEVIYIVVPLSVAHLWRTVVLRHEHGFARLSTLIKTLHPASLVALLATLVLLFGFDSGAALATVVGVLIEAPVMLAAVGVVNRTKHWYERREGVVPYEQCCPADVHQHAAH